LGLTTGGSTQTQTTTPGASTQVQNAINAAGGLGAFATPSSLYQLTPAEQLFQGATMASALPGAQASRALSYVSPGSPAGNMFQNYFRNFIAPSVTNNAIVGGYGGASGANMEALSRAGQQAAMQGLTSFGMPMAQQDMSNLGLGLQAAGLQRQTSLQDFGRIQNLLQGLMGYLPTTVSGGATQQGPGTAASLLNMGGSILGSLFNGGMAGSAGSLGGQLLGSIGSGLGSLGSSAWNGLTGLFGSGSGDSSTIGSLGSSSNPFATTAPDVPITDSGVDPNAMQDWNLWNSAGGAL